jgi:hypothetical protein
LRWTRPRSRERRVRQSESRRVAPLRRTRRTGTCWRRGKTRSRPRSISYQRPWSSRLQVGALPPRAYPFARASACLAGHCAPRSSCFENLTSLPPVRTHRHAPHTSLCAGCACVICACASSVSVHRWCCVILPHRVRAASHLVHAPRGAGDCGRWTLSYLVPTLALAHRLACLAGIARAPLATRI